MTEPKTGEWWWVSAMGEEPEPMQRFECGWEWPGQGLLYDGEPGNAARPIARILTPEEVQDLRDAVKQNVLELGQVIVDSVPKRKDPW